jgi:general secretion pathway protein K
MMRIDHCARRSQSGFALMLVLWTVVILMLISVGFDAFVARRVDAARAIRVRIQDRLDAYSTQQTLLYMLATQRFTSAGLTTAQEAETAIDDGESSAPGGIRMEPLGGELALDGAVYRGFGRMRFSLQDETGLVPLNSAADEDVRWLLERIDPGGSDVARLLDTLGDYRDDNALRRLNGAESAEYLAAGRPPPRDADLRTAAEVTRVLAWDNLLAAHPDLPLIDWLSASTVSAFNPNAMPEALLARMPGMNAGKAALAVARRRDRPFRSLADFAARSDADIHFEQEKYRFFPAETQQLRLWSAGSKTAAVQQIHLTALGPEAPWQITAVFHAARRNPSSSQEPVHEVSGPYFSTGAPATR